MGKIKFAMQQQKQKIKTKLKNGDCLIEMCHLIPSSKENTVWQKVSQNWVLGWDRVESAQSMNIFGMVKPSQQRGPAPVFSSIYEHRSEPSPLSIAPAVPAHHFCDYSGAKTNTYRQAGRTQGKVAP